MLIATRINFYLLFFDLFGRLTDDKCRVMSWVRIG